MKLYNESVINSIVDIYRTSPINPNYPHGMNCEICKKAGIECYTDSGDGYECNIGYVKYLEQKLAERKQSTVSAIPLDKVKQAIEDIENEIKFWSEKTTDSNPHTAEIRKAKANSYKHCLEILDRLIESEE